MNYSISKKECEILNFFNDADCQSFYSIDECVKKLKMTRQTFLQILCRMQYKKLIKYAVQRSDNVVMVIPRVKLEEV